MMKTYKVLSALLAYPEPELVAAGAEMAEILRREGVLTPGHRAALDRLIAERDGGDLMDAQERYVALFDRTRSLSLHLFEHVHGDSRDRGMAMVNLLEVYRGHGLAVTAHELPDYLPLLLEYLSILPPHEARAMLADAAHILAALGSRLAKRGSAYAAVFDALVYLTDAEVAPVVPADDVDDSLEALDRAWEEAAVTFGPENAPGRGDAGCSRATAMLSRMNLS